MKICKNCVLPQSYPGISFDSDGICNFCKDKSNESTNEYSSEKELKLYLSKYKNINPKYDVLLPISGGVDSSYALIKLVKDFKLRVLAFHNDHGLEDDIATLNVRKLCKALNTDLIIYQQELSFMKKLWKYILMSDLKINCCYICGNILYLNALEIAEKFNINLVINGYSKGQFELTKDKELGIKMIMDMERLIRQNKDDMFLSKFMDKFKLVNKLIGYNSRLDLEAEIDKEKILVIPFYVFQFYKTNKDQLKQKITEIFDWQPINSYPSRTTNCKMSWLNSYVDMKKLGYSVYHPEYSAMVRAGDMTRKQAMSDLAFNPPEGLLDYLANYIDFSID